MAMKPSVRSETANILIDNYIDSAYDNVALVAANITTVNLVAQWINQPQLISSKVIALDSAGLLLVDDSDTLGIFIEDGGNVGVGTADPAYPLDIVGNTRINGTLELLAAITGTASTYTGTVKAAKFELTGADLIIDSIADADTTSAPSRNAVFDALALKADKSQIEDQIIDGITANAPSQNSVFDALALKLDKTQVEDTIADGETANPPSQNAVFDALFEKVERSEWLQNGFANIADSTLAFDGGTRVFTINRTGGSFAYYVQGVLYTVIADDQAGINTVTLDDEDGLWVIYYDDAVLTAVKNPSHSTIETVILTKCSVGYVYFDTVANAGYIFEERHGIAMSPWSHRYLHETHGFQYADGLALGDFIIDDGDADEDAQFSIATGECYDEDLEIDINAIDSTTGINIFYRVGSAWKWNTQANHKCLTYSGSDRLAWDDAGTLTEVTDNYYVLLHIFATNAYDGNPIAIVGQAEYSNIAAARTGAEIEISSLVLGSLPAGELKPIATIIYQTRDTYTNSVKAKVVQNATGDNYIDWRTSPLSPGVVATDHGSLAGLEDNDHPHYATLASPDLTGSPTAPTPVATDNSTLIATTAFVTNRIAQLNLFTYKGTIDNADTEPNYPAADAGDVYVIATTAGKIGGSSGPVVETGDTLLCLVDSTASGDHATVGANWVIGQVNLQPELYALLSGAAFTGNLSIAGGSLDMTGTDTHFLPPSLTTTERDLLSPANGWMIFNETLSVHQFYIGGWKTMGVLEAAAFTGAVSITGADLSIINGSLDMSGTDTHFLPPSLTQAEIDALSPGNGWVVFNETEQTLQQYANGAWGAIGGGSALTVPKTTHGFVATDLGKIVYQTTTVNTFEKAENDDPDKSDGFWFISKIMSVDKYELKATGTITRADWTSLYGATSLTIGDNIWLGTGAGNHLVNVAPETLGDFDKPVGIVINTDTIWFHNLRGAEIGGSYSKSFYFTSTNFTANLWQPVHNLNTQSPMLLVQEASGQEVNNVSWKPTTGATSDQIDVEFSDEMITAMGAETWKLTLIGTGVKSVLDEDDITVYEPEIEENGIKLINGGAIYKFDDWNGVENVPLSGDGNGFIVPYKKSLSNVFTGFEVVGYQSLMSFKIDVLQGLNWFKSRDVGRNHRILSKATEGYFWESDTTIAQLMDDGSPGQRCFYDNEMILLGADAEVASRGENYITWNWHYTLAKVWHANGEASRKVSTPWGIVDSVEAGAAANLAAGQVVLELYNPLTGNGCLLYIGTGADRLLNISGGIAPEFMIGKNMSSTGGGRSYHTKLDGGTAPETKYLELEDTVAEQDNVVYWNDTAPTSALISLGNGGNVNGSGVLTILYYFAPVAGLQKFGGYTGNDIANNQATGCKDGLFIAKSRLGVTQNWIVYDSIRDNGTANFAALFWNLTSAESALATTTTAQFGATSGFEIESTNTNINGDTFGYVYSHFGKEMVIQGDMNEWPANGVAGSGTNNLIKITFELESTAALNSELLLYASRGSTPSWVLGSMSESATLSKGKKQVQAIIDVSGQPAGDELRWRFVTDETPNFTEHNISNLKIIGI